MLCLPGHVSGEQRRGAAKFLSRIRVGEDISNRLLLVDATFEVEVVTMMLMVVMWW
jgi:hypothetical protein